MYKEKKIPEWRQIGGDLRNPEPNHGWIIPTGITGHHCVWGDVMLYTASVSGEGIGHVDCMVRLKSIICLSRGQG